MKVIKNLLALFSILISGIVFGQDAETVFKISFQTRAGGTARSVGMGGAFTSLGADASSLHINPAGLGMYRSSEISITPSIYSTNAEAKSYFNRSPLINSEKSTNFTLNNIAAMFNLYDGSGYNSRLKMVTFGISYNKNYFSKYSSQSLGQTSDASIMDYFAEQLNSTNGGRGLPPDEINSAKNPNIYRDASPYIWGSILAFNTFLLDAEKQANGNYTYFAPGLNGGDRVNPSQFKEITTITDEVMFGLGANISDIAYIGLSMGARTFDSRTFSRYNESYVNGNEGDFDDLEYAQDFYQYGSSFDLKVGATLEPISGVKIGIAYHAPSVMFITDEIGASMSSYFKNGDGYVASASPNSIVEYDVRTPDKLLTGVSVRLGSYAILAFDYEKIWYNNMNISGLSGVSAINDDIKYLYKPTDNIYFGGELNLGGGIFARGGYSVYGSPYNKEYLSGVFSWLNIVDENGSSLNTGYDFNKYKSNKYMRTNDWAIGLGFRGKGVYFDIAYQNSRFESLPYRYFDGDFLVGDQNVSVFSSSIIEESFRRSQILFTLGFKF